MFKPKLPFDFSFVSGECKNWRGSEINFPLRPKGSSQTCEDSGHECEVPSVHAYSLLVPGLTQLHVASVASVGCEAPTCTRASAPAGMEQPRSKCDIGQAMLMLQTFTPLEGRHH